MDLKLNIEEIDKMHDEFLLLLDEAKRSNNYVESLKNLIEHTERHFAYEEELMNSKNYYGIAEHKEEHNKLLGEMRYFCEKAQKGFKPFAKAYINEYAFDKFKNHIMNIDSQLAMFLKQNS